MSNLPAILSLNDMARLHGAAWPVVARYMDPATLAHHARVRDHGAALARPWAARARVGAALSRGTPSAVRRASGRQRARVRDELPEAFSQTDIAARNAELWGPEWGTADLRARAQRLLGPAVDIDALARPYGSADLSEIARTDMPGALAEQNLRNRQHYSGTGDPVADPKFWTQAAPLPADSSTAGSYIPPPPGDPAVLGRVWDKLSSPKSDADHTAALRAINARNRSR